MNLYSDERPENSPGRKALLIDGSAVPRISVFPIPDGRMELTVFLREYKSGEPFSYSPHHAILLTSELDKFFFNYCRDPELVLEHYFHWKAQEPTKSKAENRLSPAQAKEQIQEYIDLL